MHTSIKHQASSINILCIGDSITQGGKIQEEYTYRYPLYQLLTSARYKVNFIGSRHKGLQEDFNWPKGFDSDHEGYYGKKTAYVEKKVINHLGLIEKPDIAIIHLGTNDQLVSDETISLPITRTVQALRAKNPNIKVLLVQIPGWKNLTIHFLVWKTAIELSNDESIVETIPLYQNWDVNKDTFDGVHPNQLGQKKIAALLFNHIKAQ